MQTSPRFPRAALGAAALLVGVHAAPAAVTLVAQTRTLSVATTLDPNIQTVAAPDFGSFTRALRITGSVQGPGGTVPVIGAGRIDCQIDPNKLVATGRVTGAGALADQAVVPDMGDSKVQVLVDFQVDVPTPFNLIIAPSPGLRPTDEFKVQLRDTTRNRDVYAIDQNDPVQTVNFSGTLQPGEYSFKYRVEGSFDGGETSRNFGFALNMPPSAPADCNGNGTDDMVEIVLGLAADENHNGVADSCECLANWNGGALSVQDILDFIDAWFAGGGDFDHSGETATADIFAFLNAWFAGC
jgi:hypothetical protein